MLTGGQFYGHVDNILVWFRVSTKCSFLLLFFKVNVKKRLPGFMYFTISDWFYFSYDLHTIIIKNPLIRSPTCICLKPPTKRRKETMQHRLRPHVDPLTATQDQWQGFFFFKKNSRVVLQPKEEMIYVDLISPLWWQTYDQMINGQLEKQENYWCDL